MKKHGLAIFFWLVTALCAGYLFYAEYYITGKRVDASIQEVAYVTSLFVLFVVLVWALLKKGVHPTLIKLAVLLLCAAIMLAIAMFT